MNRFIPTPPKIGRVIPPSTRISALGLIRAPGETPSMTPAMTMATAASPIPIAVAAFMTVSLVRRPRRAGLQRDERRRWDLAQRLGDRGQDAVGLERLDHEVLGAELDRLQDLGLLAQGRAHDHLRAGVDGDDLPQGGEAVLLGHGDVERHDIGAQLLEALHRLGAVGRFANDLVAAAAQGVGDHLPHERGVINDEHASHQTGTSVGVFSGRLGEELETPSTCSMRTARPPSSVTRRRPEAKRMPSAYRSIGASTSRSSSTTAPEGRATMRPDGMRVRPSSAHTRTLMSRRASPSGASSWLSVISSSARVMRTMNALGTSCTSRQGAPQKVKVTAVAWPGCSQPSPPELASSSWRTSGGAISTSSSSPLLVASAAADIIWFIASPTALNSSSDSSPPASTSLGSIPIMAAASRRAPSMPMTMTLPPVTPST